MTARSVTGKVGTDDVEMSGGTSTFGSAGLGTGKTVTGTGFGLSGTAAGNYQLAATTLTTTANITQKVVTGSFTAGNKVYDGTTAATITARNLSGKVGTEDVSLSGGSATFSSPGAGDNKTVTGTGFVLAVAANDNYTLASSSLTTTANVTQKALSGSFTAANKVYDGNRT